MGYVKSVKTLMKKGNSAKSSRNRSFRLNLKMAIKNWDDINKKKLSN